MPSLPSADGTRLPVAPQARGGGTGGLTPSARARLAREPDGPLLKRIATSRALGAPPAVPAQAGADRRAPHGDAGSALAGAMSSGAVVALLIGVAVAAAGVALARQR